MAPSLQGTVMQRSRRESPKHNSPQVMPSVQSPCKLLATLPSTVNRLHSRPRNSSPHELTVHRHQLPSPPSRSAPHPLFHLLIALPGSFLILLFPYQFHYQSVLLLPLYPPPGHLHSFQINHLPDPSASCHTTVPHPSLTTDVVGVGVRDKRAFNRSPKRGVA